MFSDANFIASIFWSQVQTNVVSSHNIHFSLVFLFMQSECSSEVLWLNFINHPPNIHPSVLSNFLMILIRCCIPILSEMSISNNPQPPPPSPHPKVHPMSIVIENPPLTGLRLNRFIYKELLLLMATPFFLIGASPQHPLKSIRNFSRPRKTSPHGLSHFIKSPYFWWSSHFSHIKISQQEPEIKNADFNRSWEDFLSGVFQIHRKLLLFMKAPQKENKTFYRKEKKNKNETMRDSNSDSTS